MASLYWTLIDINISLLAIQRDLEEKVDSQQPPKLLRVCFMTFCTLFSSIPLGKEFFSWTFIIIIIGFAF